MDRRTWGVGAVVLAVSLFQGCAPTEGFEDELASTEEALVQCGNGACEAGESCASCPGDCGRCTQSHCGDGTCGRKESCATCAADCGACPGCGNGVCDASETCTSCSKDCGRCSGEFCGNGVCGRRESCTACSRDCCLTPPPPECQNAGDCPAAGECLTATCVNGVCGTEPAPQGTPASMQTFSDCLETLCDGMGGTTNVPDDMDLPPDDGLECTADVCSMGVPQYPPAAQGTTCSLGSCDGMGTCVEAECQDAGDCPMPANGCETAICQGGSCGTSPLPDGASSRDDVSGDCQSITCDGLGGAQAENDGTDAPPDTECMNGGCSMGSSTYTPKAAGTPCSAPPPAMGVCNSIGVCI
jgi:hypothetical protein